MADQYEWSCLMCGRTEYTDTSHPPEGGRCIHCKGNLLLSHTPVRYGYLDLPVAQGEYEDELPPKQKKEQVPPKSDIPFEAYKRAWDNGDIDLEDRRLVSEFLARVKTTDRRYGAKHFQKFKPVRRDPITEWK